MAIVKLSENTNIVRLKICMSSLVIRSLSNLKLVFADCNNAEKWFLFDFFYLNALQRLNLKKDLLHNGKFLISGEKLKKPLIKVFSERLQTTRALPFHN
jgi:hypothetical protein